MSSTDKYTNSTAATTDLNEWKNIPCVQYGFPEGKGPFREPKLRTIFEPVPNDATTVSPVFILTRDQYERQQRFETGYEVKGATSIAKELQDKCEADNRVLYPIHIESDVYQEKGPTILIEWFHEFVEEYLDVPFHSCTLYFSGNRSIHAHVPRFVSGEDQREQLKELAGTFCDETGAQLDCALYDRKRLFRLPGVEHTKTELRKVEIEPEWEHTRIIREASTSTSDVPESYEAVLRRVFLKPSLMKDSAQSTAYKPHSLFRVLDSNKTVLEFESDEANIKTPFIEQEKYPDDSAAVPKWAQYNAKEFSPYANATNHPRSVAALKVKDGAFARKDKRNGAIMIPAYFYGAISCDGQFTKEQEHAPLQLSKRDYQKWDYEVGEHVVIIGGRSRNSRILCVDSWTATVVGHALTGEGANREAALDHLESEGHDIGKEGSSEPASTRRQKSTQSPSRCGQNTEAANLQRQAEEEGIGTLSHEDQFNVACRLLQLGWELAWEWFKQQFGDDFKPNVTRRQLLGVIEAYPEDYTHVEPPRT